MYTFQEYSPWTKKIIREDSVDIPPVSQNYYQKNVRQLTRRVNVSSIEAGRAKGFSSSLSKCPLLSPSSVIVKLATVVGVYSLPFAGMRELQSWLKRSKTDVSGQKYVCCCLREMFDFWRLLAASSGQIAQEQLISTTAPFYTRTFLPEFVTWNVTQHSLQL